MQVNLRGKNNNARNLFRSELSKIIPYDPGKPIEGVKKELGIEEVVMLHSVLNQG